MDEHLGYGRGERGHAPRANTRNGIGTKHLKVESGEISLDVPRDRDGSFEPQMVQKRQRRLVGFDDKVLSLYARGVSTRDIQSHLFEMEGTKVSSDLISRVTGAVMDEVQEWRKRPLNPIWPSVYLDALVLRVREGGSVRRQSAYLAIGVGVEGRKEVLGMWLEETEGARFGLKVITELKNRGVSAIADSCATTAFAPRGSRRFCARAALSSMRPTSPAMPSPKPPASTTATSTKPPSPRSSRSSFEAYADPFEAIQGREPCLSLARHPSCCRCGGAGQDT